MSLGLARRGEMLLFITVVTLVCSHKAVSSYTGCSPGKMRVVSYNDTLVPPSEVNASSQDLIFNPAKYLFHRNNIPLRLWCTESLSETTEENGSKQEEFSDIFFSKFSINVSFSEHLLLTHIITSGFSNGYVNNFSIAYSLERDGPMFPYEHSDTLQEFTSHQIDSVFPLKPPLAAIRLMFSINNGLTTPTGRLCWHLTLLGCTMEEAQEQIPVSEIPSETMYPINCPTVQPTITQTTTVFQVPTTSTPNSCTSTPLLGGSDPTRQDGTISSVMSTSETFVTKDSQLIMLVVPTAAVTLLLVTSITVIGVCVCLCCSDRKWRRKGGNRLVGVGSADSLGMVDNELYKSRSSLFPITINVTEAMVTSECSGSQSDEAIYENCPSSNVTTPSCKESRFYSSIIPRSPADLEQSTKSVDSMVENPTYNIPFPLAYHPLDASMKHIPVPSLLRMTSMAGASSIDMVDNECYSVPSTTHSDQSNNHEWMERNMNLESSHVSNIPSDYETPH